MAKKQWWEEELRETDIPKFLKRSGQREEPAFPNKLFLLARRVLELSIGALVSVLFLVAFPVVYVARVVNTLRHNAITKEVVSLEQKVISLDVRLSEAIEQYLRETDEAQLVSLKQSCRLISEEIVFLNKKSRGLLSKCAGLEHGVTASFSRFLRTHQSFDRRSFDDGFSSENRADHQRAVFRSKGIKREKAAEARQERSEWETIYNKSFLKNIEKLELSLKERVYQAITEILIDPKCAKGDTLKRLSGNHKGRWRYRIGDYRLVYMPEISERTVIFLDVGKRDEIYQKYLQ